MGKSRASPGFFYGRLMRETTTAASAETNSRTGRLSLVLLIVFNLLPVAGIVMFDWDVASLMVLYWSENLVIGFYTLVKMFIVSPVGGIFAGAFFLVHFGGFCAVHGLFIGSLMLDLEPAFPSGDRWPVFLIFIELLVAVVHSILAVAPAEWVLAFAALWVSHGVSLVQHFLLGGERDQATVGALMQAPYSRIMLLHFSIIFGGFAVLAMGETAPMLALLVILKLLIDVWLHRREHRRFAQSQVDEEDLAV